MNHYSVINGYFRFEKLSRNRYVTSYRVIKLRCLLDNIIICLYKYVDLASKFLIKIHKRKDPPLAIGLLLHHWFRGNAFLKLHQGLEFLCIQDVMLLCSLLFCFMMK